MHPDGFARTDGSLDDKRLIPFTDVILRIYFEQQGVKANVLGRSCSFIHGGSWPWAACR